MKIALPAKVIMKNVHIAEHITQTVTTVKNMAAMMKVAVLVVASIVKKNKKSAKENTIKALLKDGAFFTTIPFDSPTKKR